jgi:hypothetical protein
MLRPLFGKIGNGVMEWAIDQRLLQQLQSQVATDSKTIIKVKAEK